MLYNPSILEILRTTDKYRDSTHHAGSNWAEIQSQLANSFSEWAATRQQPIVGLEMPVELAPLLIPSRAIQVLNNPAKSRILFDNSVITYVALCEGLITSTDRTVFSCELSTDWYCRDTLIVNRYDGVRGLGIATDFYTNILPTFASELGFKYILGENNSNNINFFTEKLGRVRYEDLPRNIRMSMPLPPWTDPEFCTVQIL